MDFVNWVEVGCIRVQARGGVGESKAPGEASAGSGIPGSKKPGERPGFSKLRGGQSRFGEGFEREVLHDRILHSEWQYVFEKCATFLIYSLTFIDCKTTV
jgi:hypothetical protein